MSIRNNSPDTFKLKCERWCKDCKFFDWSLCTEKYEKENTRTMKIVPIFQRQAFDFITKVHRHHKKPVGSIFQIGLCDNDGKLVGVAVIGRPVARRSQNGFTCEVTRMCTDGSKNACSKLYSTSARIAKEMGYTKIITYILESETGVSLKASGWKFVRPTPGKSWSVPSRERIDKHPLGVKHLYEKNL